jgi:GTPase SAR1 family protein
MDRFKTIISKIAQINHSTGAPELTNPVERMLDENNKTIHVAVLGQFKSGKSSLINSIIGENILPVGVVPLTAIITRLQYGIIPNVVIHFTNGSQTNISIEELPLYVTEKHNPENVRKVDVAIVEHPALAMFKKVSIIDTPGLGSFYRHNSNTTMQWLPYTGVAMVSISAERPLAEEDINLLKGISRYCPTVAIIITKTDLFNPNELEEIKTHIVKSVKDAINTDIPIFEYSIYKNTPVCRNTLISQLIEPINKDFDKKLDSIIRFKINAIIEQSIQYAVLSLQAALKREQEKEAVNNLLKEIKTNRHHHEREILLSASSFKGEIRDKLEKIILPYLPDITKVTSNVFISDYYQWQGSLFQVSRLYEQWLKDNLSKEINTLENECFEAVNSIVKETLNYFEYSALQFRHRLDEKVFTLFGTKLPEAAWQIDFNGIDKPDISVYRAFDSHIDTLFFFLPMRFFRRIFFTHFQKQIPKEIEKNLHRFISDITYKIIKSIDNIHKQALQYISNETSTVEQILLNEKSDSTALQEKINQLKELNLTLN